MSTGSINNLSSTYLQSILGTALQGTGNNTLSSIGTSALTQSADSSQLSPFAQIMSSLQQLQQSNPTEYQQVTQQIAKNLQSAAQTAQSEGNTGAANQLNQLATDFTNASSSGQLPNMQDLAQAIGHAHHHGHRHAASGDADSTSSASSSSTSSTSQTLSQIMSAFQTNMTQSDALNPASIIMNTLSSVAA